MEDSHSISLFSLSSLMTPMHTLILLIILCLVKLLSSVSYQMLLVRTKLISTSLQVYGVISLMKLKDVLTLQDKLGLTGQKLMIITFISERDVSFQCKMLLDTILLTLSNFKTVQLIFIS